MREPEVALFSLTYIAVLRVQPVPRGLTLCDDLSGQRFASQKRFFLHCTPAVALLTFPLSLCYTLFLCWEKKKQVIPDVQARVRNVKLLVNDLPWAHKPLLLALVDLFVTMTSSSSSSYNDQSRQREHVVVGGVTIVDETGLFHSPEKGGVTVRDAAESLAPALLRPPAKQDGRGDAEASGEISVGWEEELAATSVVELILSEHNLVLEDLRAEQTAR